MSRKQLVVGFALAAVMTMPGPPAAAQDRGTDTLRGVARVAVQVRGIGADAEKDGLVPAQMQTDVELALRLAGVRVLSPSEYSTGTPVLRLTVGTFKSGDGLHVSYFYAYAINAQIFQNARLVSTPSAAVLVAT
jgi:hypothetical protein